MPAFPEKESSLLAKLKKYKANTAGNQQLDEESESSAAATNATSKSLPAAKMKSDTSAVSNGDAVNNLSGKSSPVPEPVSSSILLHTHYLSNILTEK